MRMNSSTTLFVLMGLIMPWALGASPSLKIHEQDMEDVLAESMPEGVHIALQDGVYRIQNTLDTPQQVHLKRINFTVQPENTTMWYQAAIRSEADSAPVCLEMICVTPDGGEYFSRALNDTVEGTSDWRTSRTPFFLKKNEKAKGVKLGILFQGKGTVLIRDMEFVTEKGIDDTYNWGMIGGIFGGIYGGLIGACCGIIISWARKGKRKRMVYGMAVIIGVIGVLLLIAGWFFLMKGYPTDISIILSLLGGVTVLAIGVIISVLPSLYARHDAARLERMNQAESL